jgi:hypothetical protein
VKNGKSKLKTSFEQGRKKLSNNEVIEMSQAKRWSQGSLQFFSVPFISLKVKETLGMMNRLFLFFLFLPLLIISVEFLPEI